MLHVPRRTPAPCKKTLTNSKLAVNSLQRCSKEAEDLCGTYEQNPQSKDGKSGSPLSWKLDLVGVVLDRFDTKILLKRSFATAEIIKMETKDICTYAAPFGCSSEDMVPSPRRLKRRYPHCVPPRLEEGC